MGLHHHDHSGHDHGHGHGHAPPSYGRAFALGVSLNLGFVIVEGAAGLLSGSIALIADAGHNLSDVLGLLMAWAAYALSKRPASARYTYGLRGSSILAALFNAILLLIACGAIALGAVQRFAHPAPLESGTMMAVAGVGIVINLGTALLFLRGGKHDINIRGAFLHMAADAAVSAGVVIAGFLVGQTGLLWIDPAISLVIVAVIVAGTWGLFRDSLTMSLAGVPSRIDPASVTTRLGALPGVTAVHHVHIWPTSTTETALTAHLVMPDAPGDDNFLASTARLVRDEFGIGHATFQVERGRCADAKAECAEGHHDHDHGHDDHGHHPH
ncbi:cation diffusion facilitator family transporter [Rhizorhabdus dicambivorans]|uniref:Cation transporter n=1 Tax=Rhizorhabdus dicambivorans TaxID=1850238 RepID=A0A2A4FW27_9SPHN|nr:cation diffusion facilitator family transporter [Rhizorhabdus dicambivorans]ATE65587.1 cation transporter [Rhizorhabdus dicambivorans]PCE41930.1 cation transporter [Rhizorhabdus dicambivorans]